MAIRGYAQDGLGKDAFGRKMSQVVSPAGPISSIQMLKGREQELHDIDRALYQTGRHIFIFGDRGVGKSSLGATAAVQYQSPGASPIRVSGSPDDTFASIIANIGVMALARSKTETRKRNVGTSMEFRGFRWSSTEEISPLDLRGQINTIGDAAELLKQVAAHHSEKPAIVLDEFDAIPDMAERARFAALLKQLGDQSVNVKFFITGVGRSCEELLGAHSSAHRQLATFELHRLGWNGRREIVDEALSAFELNCDNDVNWRIALISDGFPYYIHLIVEHMLWAAYDDDAEVQTVIWSHFYDGLRNAIRETNAELKLPYEKAVLQRPPAFEDVVWATADGEELLRSLPDIRHSYERVRDKRDNRPVLQNDKFSDIVRKLKLDSYGAVLQQVPHRKGWYTYREKMLRGYVRMQADAEGVQLTGEKPLPRQQMHIGNIKTGYKGPSIPPGVRQNEQINTNSTTEISDSPQSKR